MLSKIIHSVEEEFVKELDDLFEEMIQVNKCQMELIENVEPITLAQAMTLSDLKISPNTFKCLLNHKLELYNKIIKSSNQEVVLQAMKSVFSTAITVSQLASKLVITVLLSQSR